LRAAIKAHTNQVKRCATGNDVDRHLYALYCLWSKYHAKSHTRHVDAKKHLQKRKAISDLQSGGSVAATSERTELDSGAGASAEANSSRGGGGAYGASWGRCGRLFSRTSTAIYSHVLAGTHSRTSSFLPSISLSPSSLQAYTRLAKSLPPPPSFFHLHPSLSCPRHVAADIPIQSQSHTASLALPHL